MGHKSKPGKGEYLFKAKKMNSGQVRSFITICVKEVRSKGKNNGSLHEQSWVNIKAKLMEISGLKFGRTQLEDTWKAFKDKYKAWSDLMNASTNHGTNPSGSYTDWTDRKWYNYVRENPGAKQFRRRGLGHVEKLKFLFGGDDSIPPVQTSSGSSSSDSEASDAPASKSASGKTGNDKHSKLVNVKFERVEQSASDEESAPQDVKYSASDEESDEEDVEDDHNASNEELAQEDVEINHSASNEELIQEEDAGFAMPTHMEEAGSEGNNSHFEASLPINDKGKITCLATFNEGAEIARENTPIAEILKINNGKPLASLNEDVGEEAMLQKNKQLGEKTRSVTCNESLLVRIAHNTSIDAGKPKDNAEQINARTSSNFNEQLETVHKNKKKRNDEECSSNFTEQLGTVMKCLKKEEATIQVCNKVLDSTTKLKVDNVLYVVACNIFCESQVYRDQWMMLSEKPEEVRISWILMVGKKLGLV